MKPLFGKPVNERLVVGSYYYLEYDAKIKNTDFKIYTSKKDTETSILRVHYTEKLEYVSPACGIRKLYENLNPELLSNHFIINIEQNKTEILDEEKTHIYLVL